MATIEIWASPDNDRAGAGLFLLAEVPGSDAFFQHGPLDASNTTPQLGTAFFGAVTAGSSQVYTLYYWLRAKDRSGNVSAWHPLETDAGVSATTHLLTGDNIITADAIITNSAQIGRALIDDAHIRNLSASKLLAGTIDVLIALGAGRIVLDALQDVIRVSTPEGLVTVEMGRLDPANPSTRNYGFRVYDPNGVLLFDASQRGLTSAGIGPGIIGGGHIQTGAISATHLVTDVAIIRVAAQIANALIGTAHIQEAAIETALIADAAITSAKIGTAQVETAHIATAAIGSAAIQTAAIGTAQIQDAAITSAKIGTAQIQSAHIQDLSVDNAKIQNLTVGGEKIQNNAVSTILRQTTASAVNTTAVEHAIHIGMMNDVPAGSIAVIHYTGMIICPPGSNLTNEYHLRIREDNLGGAILAQMLNFSQALHPSLFVAIQAVWGGDPLFFATKFFVVSLQRITITGFGDEFQTQGQLIIQLHKK